MARTIEMPEDYALVLQQIVDDGEEDLLNIAESLRLDYSRLVHILQALRHKHLIIIRQTAYDTWVRLSSRGKRFAEAVWPESQGYYGTAI